MYECLRPFCKGETLYNMHKGRSNFDSDIEKPHRNAPVQRWSFSRLHDQGNNGSARAVGNENMTGSHKCVRHYRFTAPSLVRKIQITSTLNTSTLSVCMVCSFKTDLNHPRCGRAESIRLFKVYAPFNLVITVHNISVFRDKTSFHYNNNSHSFFYLSV